MESLDTEQKSKTWHGHASLRRTQISRESLQPWTPTRCHRLLRPLKTHVSALRRAIDQEDSEKLSDDASRSDRTGTYRPALQHTYSRRGRKAQTGLITSEGPGHSKMSASKKMQRRGITQPGEVVLPTPFIRRARGQNVSSPIRQPQLTDAGAGATGRKRFAAFQGQRTPSILATLETEMPPLRNRVTAAKFSLYESILRAFDSLLTATAVSSQGSPDGRSLMAMCLRKVPEYIGELEYWEKRDAEEQGTRSTLQNSEISNEIYAELEGMLPTSRGAGHLRTVVRAHGVKVVKDSIAEGLLDDSFSISIIKLCCNKRAFKEGEELLQELVDRSYPKPKGVDSTFEESRKLAPLKMLRDFARESGRPQFMQRQLGMLLSKQRLPLLWLSTKEFATFWCGMVRALSGHEICDDTTSFAVQIITALSTQARLETVSLRNNSNDFKSLPQQTLISVVTAISTLSILGQEARDSSLCHMSGKQITSVSGRVNYVIQRCMYELSGVRKRSWAATVLGVAAFLTKTSPSNLKNIDISGTLGRITSAQGNRDSSQHYEAVTVLVGSIAQCCGRGSAQPSHHHLTKLCDQIERGYPRDEAPRTLRMDSAFILAERTNDLRDLAFAESLDTTRIRTNPAIAPTPRKKSASTSYRWDEDICEWVTVTPEPTQRRRSLSPDLSPLGPKLSSRGEEEGENSAKYVQRKHMQKHARSMETRASQTCTPSLGKRRREACQSVDLSDDSMEALGGQLDRRANSSEVGVFARQVGTKRFRTTTRKPSGANLKTITDIVCDEECSDEECSDDELGL